MPSEPSHARSANNTVCTAAPRAVGSSVPDTQKPANMYTSAITAPSKRTRVVRELSERLLNAGSILNSPVRADVIAGENKSTSDTNMVSDKLTSNN